MIRRIIALPSGRRAKWVVLAVWIALLVPASMLSGKLGDVEKNDVSAWLPKNAEATKVLDRATQFQPSDTLMASVVYDRPGGITPADLAKAKADASAFEAIKDVVPGVEGPVQSKDGKALQTFVRIDVGTDGWDAATKAVDKMIDIGNADANGLGMHVTGQGGYAADSGKILSEGGSLLMITMLVVIVILLFTYRSPVLWLFPLITAGIALVGAESVVYLLAKHAGLTVNSQSSFILAVLVIGAATDYALLLVARYRDELRRHEDRHEAMAEALRRSSPAIVASAATVAISLMVLMLATLNSTKGMGPVCAIGILVGLLAMVTLMPALLVICGRWTFWPKRPAHGSPAQTGTGLWTRVGKVVSGRPRVVWIGTAVVLGALSLGLIGMDANGIPQKKQFTKDTQAVVGEEVQAKHFPAGSGDPIYVIAKAPAAPQVKTALEGVSGVEAVEQPIVKDGDAFILATLNSPANSKASMDTVERARTAVHKVDGGDAQLGGGTAITLDMQNAASRDSKLIIPMVLLVVFLILAVLLRAIVAPLLLMGTVILSFGAALGVSSLAFEHIFHFGGMDASFPLMAFVFLVALGIDYNIFLVTRVREESVLHGTRRGALTGLSATGGVITSAGLVLAGTFAALASIRLVLAAELGFIVAFGVLLDTLIVRSVLVTALTLDVRRRMWWPSALGRKDAEPSTSTPEEALAVAGK